MDTTILIAIQAILSVTRAIANGQDPTADQRAALDAAEAAIKKKLDDDLAAVAAGKTLPI